MGAKWKYQTCCLKHMLNSSNETKAQIYMERLLLFPIDIQDKIIDDISHLKHCNQDAVASVIGEYSIHEIK